MNLDLTMVRSLRRVLESAVAGKGVARSVVEELGRVQPGTEVARLLLLGHPLHASLRPLVEGASEETAMLASLIVVAPRTSAAAVGESGQALAASLEAWLKARESRRLERKVLRFRSVVTSGVLGAVTAMVASLGPLIGNLGFQGGPPVNPVPLLVGAASMAAISSAMLGIFMSGRGFVTNVAVTLGVFAAVAAAASPLANVPAVMMWGVK